METLPDVVVLVTAKYLTAPELVNWSAVSRNLREQLNVNKLWRAHCDPLIAEYLKNTECQVEPFFISPEIEGSSLSPICEWRLCFMRQVHLWNNWRLGRYIERFLPARSAFSHTFKLGHNAKFYKNDFLVTNNENTIEIWNLNQAPKPVALEPLLSTEDVTLLELCGDKIVVKQHYLIQVFEISISTRKINFLHSFIYHGQEKNTEKIYDDNANLSNDRDPHPCPVDFAFLIDHTLVAMFRRFPDVLHVWNIETGEKVKEERRENSTFQNFYRRDSSKEPFFTVTAKDVECNFVVMFYSVDGFVPVFTSPRYRRLPTNAFLFKDHVFIHTYETTDIYRLHSVERILQVPGPLMTDFYSIGNSAFIQTGSNLLSKFNPSSEEIENFPLISSLADGGFPLGDIACLNERYCLLGGHLVEISSDQMRSLRLMGFSVYAVDRYARSGGEVFNCVNQTCTMLLLNSVRNPRFDEGLIFIDDRRNNISRRMKLLTFW